MKKLIRIQKLAAGLVVLALSGLNLSVAGTLADSPLSLKGSVPPNVLFSLSVARRRDCPSFHPLQPPANLINSCRELRRRRDSVVIEKLIQRSIACLHNPAAPF